MLNIVHLGNGGRYTNYLKETIKLIARIRPIQLSASLPSGGTRPFRVAIDKSGTPLTREALARLMREREDITFVVGDSRGQRPETLAACDAVFSVSSLPVTHQIEAAILAEQIEMVAIYGE
jgi:23S rRNA pseudoU1915 N3-methylase RlmH